jgi:hypothetical protein
MPTDAATEKKRREWGYETDVPRCSTCIQFERAHVCQRGGTPRLVDHTCRRGKFTVSPSACCDKWCNRRGETIKEKNGE